MKRILISAMLICLAAPEALLADPPAAIDYQGKILVDELPFLGTGYFKFALSNPAGTVNYWANDGTASGEPTASVTNEVYNGVFSVSLGGTGMTAMDRAIFSNGSDLYLRVWFSDGGLSFSEMLPAQRMVSHGYAINADQLDGLDATDLVTTVTTNLTLAGDVTGAAGANQIAAGVITDADISGSAAIGPAKINGTALTQASSFSGDVSGSYNNLLIGINAVGTAEIANGTIVNADISPGAAIQGSKIQPATTAAVGVVQIAGGSGAASPFVAIDDNDTRLNGFGTVNSVTATAPNSTLTLVGTNGVTVSAGAPGSLLLSGTPMAVHSNTIYVALNGSPSGPGSFELPYDTAQAGYDAAAAAFPGLPAAVVLMGGGSYGPLTMHAGTIHVLGQSRSELDSIMVIMGVPSPPFPGGVAMAGKQRVENVVVTGPVMVMPNGYGAWVKFHNCRMLDGLTIDESYVEVQHCAISRADLSSPAVAVAPAGTPITQVGFYQSTILSVDTNVAPGVVPGTLWVGPTMADFEVIGCMIANEGSTVGGTGPAITDLSPPIPPPLPLHHYAHNVIKGPPTGTGLPAVADAMIGVAPPAAPTIVFTQNTVYGDVGGTGGIVLPAGAPQFFANNTVYGIINFPAVPPAATGWVQAGAGVGLDAAGNTEHGTGWGPGGYTLPSHWDD